MLVGPLIASFRMAAGDEKYSTAIDVSRERHDEFSIRSSARQLLLRRQLGNESQTAEKSLPRDRVVPYRHKVDPRE